jgi:segregation and condensation protein A
MSEQTVDRVSEDYRVNLEVFSGPLDLLLYLIKTEEVDIYDIPIARITRQYLRYIDLMKTLDLEVAGEFILMAATLIRIKTRLLLPHDEDDADEHDPREELIMALVEYKKYKEAGEILRDRALEEERITIPPSPVEKIKGRVELEPMTGLYDLIMAFRDVMAFKRAEAVHEVMRDEVSVEERIEVVLDLLREKESVTFAELFADAPRRTVAIVTFIAVLELARDLRLRIYQTVPFSEVRVYRTERTFAEKTTMEETTPTNSNVQGVIS